jgi:hypothetical protein
MEIAYWIIGIIIYYIVATYVCNLAERNKFVGFLFGLFLVALLPSLGAYYYNGQELSNYEKALRGEYYLYKPTDAEYDTMLKEMDNEDIWHDEKVIALRKAGKSEDEANDIVDSENNIDEYFATIDKYPGHNPPKEVIENHIAEMKEARITRVIVVSLIMIILYCFIWNKWNKKHKNDFSWTHTREYIDKKQNHYL